MILVVPDEWVTHVKQGEAAATAWQLARYYHLSKHDGTCAVCGADDHQPYSGKKVWQLDHCHRTGKIRGLVCRSCNVKLGKLESARGMPRAQKDSFWLSQAERYLKECK